MAKHNWCLCQPLPLSTWAIWANINLLCHKPLWDAHVPSACSWSWRKLLNLRDLVHSNFHHVIGNGRDTFLWFDYWLPIGPIYSLYGDIIIYDSGLPRYARVSSSLREPLGDGHLQTRLTYLPLRAPFQIPWRPGPPSKMRLFGIPRLWVFSLFDLLTSILLLWVPRWSGTTWFGFLGPFQKQLSFYGYPSKVD